MYSGQKPGVATLYATDSLVAPVAAPEALAEDGEAPLAVAGLAETAALTAAEGLSGAGELALAVTALGAADGPVPPQAGKRQPNASAAASLLHLTLARLTDINSHLLPLTRPAGGRPSPKQVP